MIYKILVLNSDSTSLKYALYVINFARKKETILSQGVVTNIGVEDSAFRFTTPDCPDFTGKALIKNHNEGLIRILNYIKGFDSNYITTLDQINGVGIIFSPGEELTGTHLLNGQMQSRIEAKFSGNMIEKSHYPNLFRTTQKFFPETPLVGIFVEDFGGVDQKAAAKRTARVIHENN